MKKWIGNIRTSKYFRKLYCYSLLALSSFAIGAALKFIYIFIFDWGVTVNLIDGASWIICSLLILTNTIRRILKDNIMEG